MRMVITHTNRLLFICFSLAMLFFTGIWAWGLPVPVLGRAYSLFQGAQQDHPQQDPAMATTFTGTLVRDGEVFALRDSAGAVYKLDVGRQMQGLEGKRVKVTGRLDTQARLIHVDKIEELAA
jgi:hypothetical protein